MYKPPRKRRTNKASPEDIKRHRDALNKLLEQYLSVAERIKEIEPTLMRHPNGKVPRKGS